LAKEKKSKKRKERKERKERGEKQTLEECVFNVRINVIT
jgi:hypothetical protein